MPRRIPGTTKVQYVNKKGRGFTFAIPVSTLTHPPLLRSAPGSSNGQGGVWYDMDTSFCDTGDLEEDMPSAVDECLRRCVQPRDDDADTGAVTIEVDMTALRELQQSFISLCRDYVLMDTRGMTTFMFHSELNNGPDYEMYDRKTMRRRHWLAIRHRYDDVKELLWPSPVLLSDADHSRGDDKDTGAAVDAREEGEYAAAHCTDAKTRAPTDPDERTVLSSMEMLDALQWLEAANTFCIRQRRAYDVAPERDFGPIHLQREVRVCIARAMCESRQLAPDPPLRAEAASSSPSTRSLHDADTYMIVAALCSHHGVPFSQLWHCLSRQPNPAAAHAVHGRVTAPDAAVSSLVEDAPIPSQEYTYSDSSNATLESSLRTFVCGLPALTSVREVVRAMHAIQSWDSVPVCRAAVPSVRMSAEDRLSSPRPSRRDDHHSRDGLGFSDACSGRVVDAALLSALSRLCACDVLTCDDALDNIDEEELCVVMGFLVRVYEANARYFALATATPAQGSGSSSSDTHDPVTTTAPVSCEHNTKIGLDSVQAGCSDASSHRGMSASPLVDALAHLTRLTRARCRELLLQTTVGVGATVMSGEREACVPLATMSRHREANHPQAHGHFRIAQREAQGLRHAPLHAHATAALLDGAERLTRVACGGGNGGADAQSRSAWLSFLTSLTRHITTATTRQTRRQLDLPAVTRVLLILARLRARDAPRRALAPTATHTAQAKSEAAVTSLFRRPNEEGGAQLLVSRHRRCHPPTEDQDALFARLAESVASSLALPCSFATVVALLSAMAACHFVPHIFPQIEATLLRLSLLECERLVQGVPERADMAETSDAAYARVHASNQQDDALFTPRHNKEDSLSTHAPRHTASAEVYAEWVTFLRQLSDTLLAMLRLVGVSAVSPVLMSCAARAAVVALTHMCVPLAQRRGDVVRVEAVRVLRMLRLCRFASLHTLVSLLHEEGTWRCASTAEAAEEDDDWLHRNTQTMVVEENDGRIGACLVAEWECSVGILLTHAALTMADKAAQARRLDEATDDEHTLSFQRNEGMEQEEEVRVGAESEDSPGTTQKKEEEEDKEADTDDDADTLPFAVHSLMCDAQRALQSGLTRLASCAPPHSITSSSSSCTMNSPFIHPRDTRSSSGDDEDGRIHSSHRVSEWLAESVMACAALGDSSPHATLSATLTAAMDAHVLTHRDHGRDVVHHTTHVPTAATEGAAAMRHVRASELIVCRVHDGVTPHMAVSVLDSLGALRLCSAGAQAMREAYTDYLIAVLEALWAASEANSAPMLPAEDADVVCRVLGLTELPVPVATMAAELLLRELARGDVLSRGGSSIDGYAGDEDVSGGRVGHVDGGRSVSVEQQNMWRRGEEAALRDTASRYMTALMQNAHAAALLRRACQEEQEGGA